MTITAVEAADSRKSPFAGFDFERVAGLGLLSVLAAGLIYNFFLNPTQFVQVTLTGVQQGAIYALIALGYTLVYGIIELINFAHGDLFMLATIFTTYLIAGAWLWQPAEAGAGGWLWLFGSLAVVMVLCSLINVAAEFLAYRKLRRAPKLAPLITAVGVSFIFQWVGQQLNGSGQKNWPTVVPATGGIEIGPVVLEWKTILVIAVTIPLLLLLNFVVQKTRQGRAMRATAQDQDAARLMGINVNRTISFTFAIGGAMAGAAGVLFLQSFGTTRYDLGFQLGLIAFTAAVLGGIGNLNGAVLGGFVIGVIQAYNDGLPFSPGQKWSQTAVFTILILLMVFKPEGILGKPTQEKV